MNIKFYMTPGSCSTGIHLLLEEAGLVFEAYLVNLLAGDQHKPDYLALNPKGTIPTLVRPDGSSLTDFLSIAWWLAKSYPRAKLLPDSLEAELRALEIMNFAVNQLHGQAFARIFTSEKFATDLTQQESIKQQGETLARQGFGVVNNWLTEADYALGAFSIADAALFYVEFWADRIGLALPAKCAAHYQRMLKRPAVRQVLAEEGYGALFR